MVHIKVLHHSTSVEWQSISAFYCRPILRPCSLIPALRLYFVLPFQILSPSHLHWSILLCARLVSCVWSPTLVPFIAWTWSRCKFSSAFSFNILHLTQLFLNPCWIFRCSSSRLIWGHSTDLYIVFSPFKSCAQFCTYLGPVVTQLVQPAFGGSPFLKSPTGGLYRLLAPFNCSLLFLSKKESLFAALCAYCLAFCNCCVSYHTYFWHLFVLLTYHWRREMTTPSSPMGPSGWPLFSKITAIAVTAGRYSPPSTRTVSLRPPFER